MTLTDAQHHHGSVLAVARAIAATLIAVLIAGPVGLCAGWQATPEERMACCAEGVACPMHKAERHQSDGKQAITQAEADSCCAAGEKDKGSASTKTSPIVSPAVVAEPTVLAPFVMPRLLTRHDPATDRTLAVPRHLLLSVFLI